MVTEDVEYRNYKNTVEKISSVTSETDVSSVPQGSVFGLMFFIYNNNLLYRASNVTFTPSIANGL